MAVLTAEQSITSTGLKFRGSLRDIDYTGSVVLRSVNNDCDGSLILNWENGKLLGQFWSSSRSLDFLSNKKDLVYQDKESTIVTEDKGPIKIKSGKYMARFYQGHSAYYAHAAIRSSCGCSWCPEPCDRIWEVKGGSIQSIHDSEERLPAYEEWIPMAYYLGIYGNAYKQEKVLGNTSPVADRSKMFRSGTVSMPLDSLVTKTSNTSDTATTITSQSFDVPEDLAFLDLSDVDFCSTPCETAPGEMGDIYGPPKCRTCGKPATSTTGAVPGKTCSCKG